MSIIAVFTAEGFKSEVVLTTEDGQEVVRFRADADIDADGANGQHGKQAAYMRGDKGSDYLANGGMGMRGSRVVGVTSWWTSIVLAGGDGQPLVLPNGVVPSMTAYKFPDKDRHDPSRYVDSETVPYIVASPVMIQRTRGAVLGCRATVRHLKSNVVVEGVVADVGPRTKIGEVSIEMARRLRIPHSPKTGGVNNPVLEYTVYPGVPAEVEGVKYVLQRSNGTYVR